MLIFSFIKSLNIYFCFFSIFQIEKYIFTARLGCFKIKVFIKECSSDLTVLTSNHHHLHVLQLRVTLYE